MKGDESHANQLDPTSAEEFPQRTNVPLKDETACKYCPYIAICRFDKYISGYNYREINQLNDEEIIEKLKQKEGIHNGKYK